MDDQEKSTGEFSSAPPSLGRMDLGPGSLPVVADEEKVKLLKVLDDYVQQHGIKRLVDTIARRRSQLDFHSLAILSLKQGEGRTFLTAVLARGLVVYLSARVLIVDATGRTIGSSLLAALASPSLNSQRAEIGSIGSCTVVSLASSESATHNQNEFLCGDLVRRVQHGYDIVLVDTQPLAMDGVKGFDADIIAQQLDASIMIVPRDPIQPEALALYREKLGRLSAPCIGFVTNDKQAK